MGREVEGRFKREGTYVYLWLIHVGVWQRPTQYCNYPLIKNKRRVFFFFYHLRTILFYSHVFGKVFLIKVFIFKEIHGKD